MKIVIKDIFLKQTLSIQENYMIYMVIYQYRQKEKKLINVKSSCLIYAVRKIRCTHKVIKRRFKSRIKIEKGS